VKDYAIEPSAEKSFCDEKSLKSYGVMPSQKGRVTKEELEAIAKYMYDHYDPKKFLELMRQKAEWERLPFYEKVLRKGNCLSCHDVKKDKIAPSFERIAKRYLNDKEKIIESVKKGSRKKWKGFKAVMPPFGNLSSKELDALADWILSLDKKEDKED
jgi:cytochrome c